MFDRSNANSYVSRVVPDCMPDGHNALYIILDRTPCCCTVVHTHSIIVNGLKHPKTIKYIPRYINAGRRRILGLGAGH